MAVSGVLLCFAVPAFPASIDVSTGVSSYTVVENNAYNLGATGTAGIVTPSDADQGFSGGWVANNSSSDWVAYNPNTAAITGSGLTQQPSI